MRLSEVRPFLARLAQWEVAPHGRIYVDVELGVRAHRVRVLDEDGWLRVEGRVIEMDHVPMQVRDLAQRILRANALSELVSLARDEDGWLVARQDLPPDAEGEELAEAIERVARTADRWEMLWSEEDVL